MSLFNWLLGRRGSNQLAKHSRPIVRLAVSPDGSLIASASGSVYLSEGPFTLAISSVKARKPVYYHEFDAAVRCLSFSVDGRHLAVALNLEAASAVAWWDVEARRILRRFGPTWPDTLGVTPDGRGLLIGEAGDAVTRTFAMWNPETGQESHRYHTLQGMWRPMLSGNGCRIVGLMDKGETVCVADADTGAVRASRPASHVLCVECDHECRYVLAGGGERVQHDADYEPEGQLYETFRIYSDTLMPLRDISAGCIVSRATFSPDGRYILHENAQGRALVTEWNTGRVVRQFAKPELVSAIRFSPDGRFVILGGQDGSVWLSEV